MILKDIADQTGIDVRYLALVARTAGHRYKHYQIPKRDGGKREIAQPSKSVKFLQRWLNQKFFRFLPVSSCALAYKSGSNILQNAQRHRYQRFSLRIDFHNFFPSITSKDIRYVIRDNRYILPKELSSDDINTICSIVCLNGRLTIGAPSSPVLSNAVMFKFDRYWEQFALNNDLVYSRYADDIFISTRIPNILQGVLQQFRTYVQDMESPKLKINESKISFTSRKHRRKVTGLIITPDYKLSLGRQKKRLIKGLVFQFTNKTISPEDLSYLRGCIAQAASVEKSFINSLRRKYGPDTIERIVRLT
ncbi:MAG: retron St85 family RNA-directed DNA polymerase [Pseudomonadota bacterium]